MPVDHDTIVKVLVAGRGKMIAYILTLTQDLHASEDVYQTVLMRALRDCDKIDGPEHLMNWARRVARNATIDGLKSAGRHAVSLDTDVLAMLESDWERLDADAPTAMSEVLGDCLEELSPQARELVRLRFAEDLTVKQVADRVDRPLSSVYVSMSRIYKKLSRCVEGKLAEERADG